MLWRKTYFSLNEARKPIWKLTNNLHICYLDATEDGVKSELSDTTPPSGSIQLISNERTKSGRQENTASTASCLPRPRSFSIRTLAVASRLRDHSRMQASVGLSASSSFGNSTARPRDTASRHQSRPVASGGSTT